MVRPSLRIVDFHSYLHYSPAFSFLALLAYAFYANTTLLSMSLVMSKTRKQFLGTHLLVQYGLGGLLMVLSGLVSALDASRAVQISEYLNHPNLLENAISLITALLFMLAFFNVVMLLGYRFGYRLLIPIGIYFVLTNIVFQIPTIRPIIDAIAQMPAIVWFTNFRNTLLYDVLAIVFLTALYCLLTLRMPVKEKALQ